MTQINSTLYLCKNVPLDPNYNYTLDFDNLTAQSSFFDDLVDSTLLVENEDYSYIRDSQTIKVFKNIDDLLGVNYLFYNNGDKRYYAFITKKEYKSSTCTEIIFKIDVLQSFMFDYSISESFVEREHQDRYRLANNLLHPIFNRESEAIERGQNYITASKSIIPQNVPQNLLNAVSEATNKGKLFWFTIVAKEPISSHLFNDINGHTSVAPTITTNINNMITNVYTYIVPVVLENDDSFYIDTHFKCSPSNTTTDTAKMVSFVTLGQLQNILQDTKVISVSVNRYTPFEVECRKSGNNYIVNVKQPTVQSQLYVYTEVELYSYNYENNIGYGALFYVSGTSRTQMPELVITHDLTKLPSVLNIENLKNIELEPKLFISDYSYYELELGSNKQKISIEDLPDNEFKLKYVNAFSIKNGHSFIPLNYRNKSEDADNSLSYNIATNELPLRSDAWLNYLASSKASMISGLATKAITGVGAGLFAGGGIGAVVGGIAGIAQQVAQIHDIKNTPDEVKQTSTDLVLDYVNKDLYINVYLMEVYPQFKNRLFSYFYHYGYKCNDFKVPNVRSRYYFNYIKTIDCNIATNIDNDYRNEIATIFDRGITIWHYRNATTFKGVNNYNYENVETNLISEEE